MPVMDSPTHFALCFWSCSFSQVFFDFGQCPRPIRLDSYQFLPSPLFGEYFQVSISRRHLWFCLSFYSWRPFFFRLLLSVKASYWASTELFWYLCCRLEIHLNIQSDICGVGSEKWDYWSKMPICCDSPFALLNIWSEVKCLFIRHGQTTLMGTGKLPISIFSVFPMSIHTVTLGARPLEYLPN